jgi:hypothetical protein
MKRMFIISLLALTCNLAYSQQYSMDVSSSGNISSSDSIFNSRWGNVLKTLPFADCFFTPVTTYTSVVPRYGNSWFFCGKVNLYPNPAYTSDIHYWGTGFDVCVNLDDQAAKDYVINNPRMRAQLRWAKWRVKLWNWNGDEITARSQYQPNWTIDGGIFFPDGKKYRANSAGVIDYSTLVNSVVTRLAENNSVFKVFDHPGLSEVMTFDRPDTNDIAEVGLSYTNFIAQFVDETGTPLLSENFHVKVLLREDTTGTSTSGYLGNAAFGAGHISLPDWQNPPTGTQLP